MARTHVIVGDGVAGMSAAHAIRLQAPGDRIIVVTDDPQPFYFRASLTNYLIGELSVEELDALPAHAWEELGVERRVARAVRVDVRAQRLELDGFPHLGYDRLLVATGARARRLETPARDPRSGVPGADLAGVGVMRTFHDTQRVVEAARRAKRAVVVGGGILGLEAAQGLVSRGLSVTLVHRQPHLFERVLDARAADLLCNRMRRAGVDVRLAASVGELDGDRTGRVRAVTLSDGTSVPAELVLAAIGNVPNTEWLTGSGIALGKDGSVPVDVEMRVRGTSNVYAAGDLVNFSDADSPWRNPGGLWQPARKQGRVAGLNMAAGAADASAEYRPGVLYNATRAWDLEIGSLGFHVDDLGGDDARVYDEVHDGVPVYKKAVLRLGSLRAVLLVGDRREGQALRRLMNLVGPAADVTAVRDRLFDPDFDLFAYVARQESVSARAVWRKTVHLPRGPLPPSLAVQRGRTVQLGLALGVRPSTSLGAATTGALVVAHGDREDRFQGPTVRVGAARGADVRVDAASPDVEEVVVLAREGAVWSVFSTAGRRAAARVNGAPLRGTRRLADRDVVELGRWRGVVRLSTLPTDVAPVRLAPVAALVGARRVELFAGRTYSIGASRDNDVVLATEGVSDHHAQLEVRGDAGACWLKDLGSAAGTFVGHVAVTLPRRLQSGDALRFGPHAAVVFQPSSAPSGAAVAGAAPAATSSPGSGVAVYLEGLEGPFARRTFAVTLGATVGRGTAADVVLADPLVSAVHARFAGTPSAPTVVDLGSSNGLVVRGQAVEPDRPVSLHDGDDIRIGRTRFRFTLAEPVGRAAPSPAGGPVPPERAAAAGRTTVVLAPDGPRLVEELDDGRPLVRVLGEREVRLGRAASNTIVLPRRDVSGHHAKLTLERRAYVLEDLGSRYGTRVNHRPLVAGQRVQLADGDRVEFASVVMTYAAGRSTPPPSSAGPNSGGGVRGARLLPVQPEMGIAVPAIVLEGDGPFVLGREVDGGSRVEASGEFVSLPFPTVSRRHARIARTDATWTVVDLGSANGTTVDGVDVGATPVLLAPGSVVGFQRSSVRPGDLPGIANVLLRFELVVGDVETSPPFPQDVPPSHVTPRRRRDAAFVVDGAASTDTGLSLDRVVADELDACIGCHDCMRACPLEEATTVSIGALNAFADGVGRPTATAIAFAQRCTQCHACVPVCPVDIRRSRIVLFNKLKPEAQPSLDARIVFQVGDAKVESVWTLADAVGRLADSPLLAALAAEQRTRLLAAARWRRLAPAETLVVEGSYVDALWVVVEGRLEVVADLGSGRIQVMTTLVSGQTAGETSVLSDQPAEFGVRAAAATTVVGFPRHALEAMKGERHLRPVEPGRLSFAETLESLYVGKSVEAHLRRLPSLAGEDDRAVEALLGTFDAERHEAGDVVLEARDAGTTFGLVRRGFAKEVRIDGGREIVANYLKAGDAFGGHDSGRRGTFARFEAATRVEVLTAQVADLRALDATFPALSARVLGGAAPVPDCRPPEAHERMRLGAEAGVTFGRQVLVIDTRLCVDCDNCVSACERRHGHSRLDRTGRAQQIGPYQIPASCYHCDDPKCLLCAVDGIVRDPTGEIRIVEDRCIGCGACAERCPYDNIEMVAREPRERPLLQRLVPDPVLRWLGLFRDQGVLPDPERVAVKCDLCVGYRGGPACVRACPVGAAARVDPLGLFCAAEARP